MTVVPNPLAAPFSLSPCANTLRQAAGVSAALLSFLLQVPSPPLVYLVLRRSACMFY